MASKKLDTIIKSYQREAKQMEKFAKESRDPEKSKRYGEMAGKMLTEAARLSSPEAQADFEADATKAKAEKKAARSSKKGAANTTEAKPMDKPVEAKNTPKKEKAKAPKEKAVDKSPYQKWKAGESPTDATPAEKAPEKNLTTATPEEKEAFMKSHIPTPEDFNDEPEEEKKTPNLRVIKGGEPSTKEEKKETPKPAEKKQEDAVSKEETKKPAAPEQPMKDPAMVERVKPRATQEKRTFEDYNVNLRELHAEGEEASRQLSKYGIDGSIDINADAGTVTKKYEKVSEGVFAPTDPEARKRWEADQISSEARRIPSLVDDAPSSPLDSARPTPRGTRREPGAPSRSQDFSAGHSGAPIAVAQTQAQAQAQMPTGPVVFAEQNRGAGAKRFTSSGSGGGHINTSSDPAQANQIYGNISGSNMFNVTGGNVGTGLAASTKGRASAPKGGMAVSTGGAASTGQSHPRAKNTGGGRPTTKKANPRTKKP